MTLPSAEVSIRKTSATQEVEDESVEERQKRKIPPSAPPVVLRSTPGRTTWTKRLSKTIQRRSGSFLNTLVPFRKNLEQNQSNTMAEKAPVMTPFQHKRRASAAPAVSLQVSFKDSNDSPVGLLEKCRPTTANASTTTNTNVSHSK
ncbi:unnamed protein product [Thelazia callipaeda]|uniref:Uncharacterized protein n=1 Tax=Thelazia callipaeda TaxID=103827 RepID=A0A0N5CZT5_THECL|nr:unnamed protein product [Thelazia callipaeda]